MTSMTDGEHRGQCVQHDLQEVRDGKFKELLENLMQKPLGEIQELYNHREIEA